MEKTLEQKYGEEMQRLVDDFKNRLKNAADHVIGDFYADVTNYAATDAVTNYHNFLRDEFKEYLKTDILSGGGHYSWAHGIRMELLEKHSGRLSNKIIDDLQEKLKSSESRYQQLMEMRGRY